MKKYLIFLFSIFIFFSFALSNTYNYQQIPRISYVKGNVQIEDQNGGWSNCDLNLPVLQGNRIVTGDDGRVEVEFDDGSAFRADSNCEFFLSVLTYDYEKIEVVSGNYILKTVSDIDYEILTSIGSVLIKNPSNVRVDIRRNGEVKIFVRDGKAYFRNAFFEKKIKEGRGLYVYNGGREYSKIYSRNLDDFDFWSDRRDSRYTYSESRKYIPNTNIYVGIYDLDHYGRWVFLDDFGYCWVPAIYDVEWAPYRYGYWRYCDPWGWTWVSYEPWGWLPYHYGRWHFSVSFGWVWIPGRHWSISYWSPGLVRFSIWDNYIGWVPLGPGDYYCYGCGWNRNLTVINNYNYTNVNYYNLTNLHVKNAATIVNISELRRGRPIVRKDSIVKNHRPYITEAARMYRGDQSFVNKMFSKERIVKRKLNIKPATPLWRKNIRISELRRGISINRGNGYRSPSSSFHRRYSRESTKYRGNRSNSLKINNGNRRNNRTDISRNRIDGNHTNRSSSNFIGNQRNSIHRSSNSYGYHRNNNTKRDRNQNRRNREDNFHIEESHSPNRNFSSHREFNRNNFHREKPSYNYRRDNYRNRKINVITPRKSYHTSHSSNRSYRNFNFSRRQTSSHNYSYRSHSVNRSYSSRRNYSNSSNKKSNSNYRRRR